MDTIIDLINILSLSIGITIIDFNLNKSKTRELLEVFVICIITGIVTFNISDFLFIPILFIALTAYSKFKTKRFIRGIILVISSASIIIIATFIPATFVALLSLNVVPLRKTLFYNCVFATNNIIFSYILSRLLVYIFAKISKIIKNIYGYLKIIYIVLINFIVFIVFIFMIPFLNSININFNMKLDILNISYIALFLISTLFTTFFLRKIIQAESEKAIVLAELGVNQKLYETTSKMKNDIECFKHDQSKIFSSLKIYIDEERHQELKTFYYENLLPIQNNIIQQKTATVEIENLYNIPLKSTVYSSILKAFELGIFVSIEVDETIEEINMPIINLCRIIGIFIENAIEEAWKVLNGKVLICFLKEENGILIVIKNTCENSQNTTFPFQNGYTTKGINHGYGLKIVKNLISENSNVFLNTFISNGFFTQELFIENK